MRDFMQLGDIRRTPQVAEMVITPDATQSLRWRSRAQGVRGRSEDLLKNIHGVASVAELDGDEIGFLVWKVGEIKRQK